MRRTPETPCDPRAGRGRKLAVHAVRPGPASRGSEARAHPAQSRSRVLCPIWKAPYMTVNRDTFVDSVILESGGENVFAGHAERYPVFTLAEAAERRPDLIILPTEPYHFTDSDKEDFRALGAGVPAVRDGRIHIVEGELLSWYGPRLPRALLTLRQHFAAPGGPSTGSAPGVR